MSGNCYSMWPLAVSTDHLIIWSITCWILSAVMVPLNIFLIYALCKTNQIGLITNKFIALMSTSDTLIGALVLPCISVMLTRKANQQLSCTFELSVQYLAFVFGYISFFSLIAVAFDRYLHLTKLTKYNTFMSPRKMKFIIAGICLTSVVFAIIILLLPSFYLQMLTNATNLIGIFGTFMVYLTVLRRITSHSKAMELNQTSKVKNINDSMKRKRDASVTKTVTILLGSVLVLYMPYNVTTSLWTYYRYHKRIQSNEILSVSVFWSYLALFCNGIANACVFGHGNRRIRDYTSSLFRCKTGVVQIEETAENTVK